MCGIGVVWGPGDANSPQLKIILSTIEHRGNSLYESLEIRSCALGTNRLEIVDRGNGGQPKKNEDKTIFAVLNGEVFNHKELKAELVEKGHRFESDCDTETLVHLYEEYGEGMLEKIDSEMFAFAVYDSKKNELFAARDRWGVKPLYWAKEGETYYFASEIKGLAGLEGITRIKLFPPGHDFKNGKFSRYYRPKTDVRADISEEEAVKGLRKLFDEAVKKRVDTDLPVGVFLSGGLDSTAILATALKYHKDIVAIIVGKKDSEDVKFAKKYCEEKGVKYFVRSPPGEEELFKDIERNIYICETFEPNVVRQSAISYFIAKAAKEFWLRIVLCGEGADELFLGYPEFKLLGKRKIIETQRAFLNSLHRTQFQRVDRTSMHFTIEVRVPFFDEKIVELANSLPIDLKIKGGVEKYILRKAMEDRLPDYICKRRKVVLSEGAGYGGNQSGGLFEELAGARVSNEEFERIKRDCPEWNIATKEEAFYFGIFRKFGFDKAEFNKKRVVANRSNSLKHESKDEKIMKVLESSEFSIFSPRHEERLKKIVRGCIVKNKSIKLFMLWGVWRKNGINFADVEAVEILGKMLSKIKNEHGPGANLTIVLTDSHAELNGVEKKEIYGYDSYMASIERYARSKGYETKRLSEVLGKASLGGIGEEARKIEGGEIWGNLVSSAEKYYGGKDKLEGARAYVGRRLAEKPILSKIFEGSIFLTYNGPRYDALAPDLPTLYIISNKKRESGKPWFTQ
ncbi:MAG: asparagine synthase-related protein [Candidatus Micrarchaeota archaeon]